MPEESPLDGSELEQIQEPQEQAAETPGEPEQPEQTATAQPPQQPQTPNIPEQFKDYTPEQWFQEWNKTNSQLGRYRQELTNAQQREQAYAAYLQQTGQNRQQPSPSSLPGQEARQGQQPKADFWENPETVISEIVNQGIQSYEQKQIARQQQAIQQRQATINSVGQHELSLIRLEADDYNPQLDALIRALDATDPEIQKLTENPNVTEQEIRQAVRGLYDKASKMLSGYVDPAKLKAFNQATKQAAMNGAPNPTAGLPSSPSPYGDVPEDVKERWGFLLNGG